MTLDNAVKLHDYFKEVLSSMATTFGSVELDNVKYTLVDEPVLTGRVIDNGYDIQVVADGEDYNFEMSTTAIDDHANVYTIYWVFWDTKGEDGKDDLSDFDYGVVDRIDRL